MAKTQAELIRELARAVDTLNERTNNVRDELKRLDAALVKHPDRLGECDKRVALVQQQSDDLKRNLDEVSKRRWGLVQGLVLAVMGCVLTLLVQWLISHFRRP